LGLAERDSGHRRVPDPPDRMTGVIKIVEMAGSMVQKGLSLSAVKWTSGKGVS